MKDEKVMIKNIAIVSLSSGTIGEDFVKHEVDIGIKRLNDFGMTVKFMPHALKGMEYVKNHPAERAADLLQALRDPGIDMILCAIGGDDTYRLLPYLFEHNQRTFLWKQIERNSIPGQAGFVPLWISKAIS